MTANEFHAYLLFAAALAAALGVVNVLRPQKRWLGAGAVCLSVGALLYAGGLPTSVAAVPCALALFCMAKDVAGRTGKPSPGKTSRRGKA